MGRLVSNIFEYIKQQNFVDVEDVQVHLKSLPDGVFGIEEREIMRYYTPYGLSDYDGKMICSDCEAHWNISAMNRRR